MLYGTDRQVRLYYSAADICKELSVTPILLQSWEDTFIHHLKPKKNRAGKKVFKPKEFHFCQFIQKCFLEGWKSADILYHLQTKTEKEILLILTEKEFSKPIAFHSNKNSPVSSTTLRKLKDEIVQVIKLLEP